MVCTELYPIQIINEKPNSEITKAINISKQNRYEDCIAFNMMICLNSTNHDEIDRVVSENNQPEENKTNDDTKINENIPPQVEEQVMRALVEWIYPNGPPPEPTYEDQIDQIHDESIPDVDYIVDPADVYVIETVDGEIIPNRRCFLKAFGCIIFDDTFTYKLNPKLYTLLLGILSLSIVAIVSVGLVTDSIDPESSISMSSTDSNIVLTSMSSSYDSSRIPSSFPSTTSDEAMLQHDSPQN